ncbi:hypothetical protein LCGC14_0948940 [marine sediment metagenome]|uniref:HNH nuclease domain-containing protein n=1 Tax=marine sediment metagenome TaxID=412755 RepID=A0A0F9RPB9_9ZZZZ
MSRVLDIGDPMKTLIITDLGEFRVYRTGEVCHVDSRGMVHLLTPFMGKRGYYNFYVRSGKSRKHLYLHRLLAMAFVSNPKNLPQIRHLDGNKLNNNIENLIWGTQAENNRDKARHGVDNSGERCGSAKLTWPIVQAIRKLIKRKCPVSQMRLAEFFGVSQPTICDILKGKTWHAY